MFGKKSEDRFEVIYSQGKFDTFRIIVDTHTGAHYLNSTNGASGGLTALLDKDGKPVVKEYPFSTPT